MLETEVSLFPTPAVAAKNVQEFRRALSSKTGRAAFTNALATGFQQGSKLKLKRGRALPARLAQRGPSSVHVSATFVLADGNVPMHMMFVQTDRALALFVAMPAGPRFPRADLQGLARLQAKRLQDGVPRSPTSPCRR